MYPLSTLYTFLRKFREQLNALEKTTTSFTSNSLLMTEFNLTQPKMKKVYEMPAGNANNVAIYSAEYLRIRFRDFYKSFRSLSITILILSYRACNSLCNMVRIFCVLEPSWLKCENEIIYRYYTYVLFTTLNEAIIVLPLNISLALNFHIFYKLLL